MRLLSLFLCCLALALGSVGITSELPALKEVPAWSAGPPDFVSYQGANKAFYVRRTYTREDGARIEVFLAGGAEGARLARVLKGRIEIDTPEYKLKYSQKGPYQTLLSYSPQEKKGFWAVFLNETPVLVLLARFYAIDAEEAFTFLKALDWPQLYQQAKLFFEGR